MSSHHTSSSRRHRSSGNHRGHRSPTPKSEPSTSDNDDDLPTEFGRRVVEESKLDNNTVLKRMKTAFKRGPLRQLYLCIKYDRQVKVWIRNFTECRGYCIGYVVAFDTHWNLAMSDVFEFFAKPKKRKSPFLLDREVGDALPELKPKVPRVKKERTPEELAALRAAEEAAAEKKKMKKLRFNEHRRFKQLFIRGESIMMIQFDEKDIALSLKRSKCNKSSEGSK
ncbi:U7 snRNA-associated Sm-like protein LSm11 [Argiope bruennichi]|uniref:U7 snRNA-associated Sm-like protein LSm11 n=1 Tax=Argiope bruennichi TaxID=94029 RepID=A0A8T0EKB7_ARGBR|nr:U7 snRNA-associated Sm-like protein LSm11 [Argiope bruennichi]